MNPVYSVYRQVSPSLTLSVSNNDMIFAGHAAPLFQTRPHARSVSGFRGNWRPPARSNELCSLVKAGQTPLLSCQRVTMASPQQEQQCL